MVDGVKNFSNRKYLELQTKLEEVKDKQGIVGKTWNGFKELTGLGVSEDSCENMLENFKKGKLSFEEAVSYIEEFEKKQDSSVDLLTNIATGVGAIAFTTFAPIAGTGALAVALSAPVGSVIKAGTKIIDRATNDVENDALNSKEIIKDAVKGAVTGATSTVSSGIFKGRATGTMELATSIKNGAKCGLACGALSGSTSYITDTALDEDKDFNTGELIANTATSALVSGTVGGLFGAGAYSNVTKDGIFAHVNRENLTQAFAEDSVLSSARKIAGNRVNSAKNFFKTSAA